MRINRCLLILAAFGITAVASGCAALKEQKLRAPNLFGLEQVATDVYASADMSAVQRRELLTEIAAAKPRVAHIFGSVVSEPTVYAFTNEEHYQSLGGYGAGRALGNGIMVLPRTMNSGALAHEWTHVELYARTGQSDYKKMPMWFHEGLATVVGDLPQHSEAVWQEAVDAGFPIPPLDELTTLEDWSAAFGKYSNARGLNVVYATAGREVRNWYGRAGQRGLLELLAALRGGGRFEEVYASY